MGYVAIQTPFRVQAADKVVPLEDRPRRPGLTLKLALTVRLSVFDVAALTKVLHFLTRIDEPFTKNIQ